MKIGTLGSLLIRENNARKPFKLKVAVNVHEVKT